MIFTLDGRTYNVRVTALQRKFSVQDFRQPGRTMDGKLHRDVLGTYYHYSMTVAPLEGYESEMDTLWQAVSQPVESHLCLFPYSQQALQQQMYITGGSQELTVIRQGVRRWGSLTLEFTATEPEVLP